MAAWSGACANAPAETAIMLSTIGIMRFILFVTSSHLAWNTGASRAIRYSISRPGRVRCCAASSSEARTGPARPSKQSGTPRVCAEQGSVAGEFLKSPHRAGSALQTVRNSPSLRRARLRCAGEFLKSAKGAARTTSRVRNCFAPLKSGAGDLVACQPAAECVEPTNQMARSGAALATRKPAREAGDKIARPTRQKCGLPLSYPTCRRPSCPRSSGRLATRLRP